MGDLPHHSSRTVLMLELFHCCSYVVVRWIMGGETSCLSSSRADCSHLKGHYGVNYSPPRNYSMI